MDISKGAAATYAKPKEVIASKLPLEPQSLRATTKELLTLIERQYETTGDPALKDIVARAKIALAAK